MTTTDPSSATVYYPTWVAGITSGSTYSLRANNDLRLEIRAGTTSTEGYAIFRVGNGTDKGVNGNKWGAIDVYLQYGANVCRLYANRTTATRYVSLPDNSGEIVLNTLNSSTSSAITRSSGLTISSQAIRKWGKLCQLTLTLTGNQNNTVGSNAFVGTITDTAYRPMVEGDGTTYYGSTLFAMWIQSNGTITVRTLCTAVNINTDTITFNVVYLV